MPLTDCQSRAFQSVISATHDPGVGVVLFTGYAGTGKTFTLATLVNELVDMELEICLATPTHKASRCLEKALAGLGARVRYVQTVAQILGQRLKRDLETGKEVFVYPDDANELPGDVLIIDEASMVPVEAFERIVSLRQPHQTIVFVGDPAQVPPVKDGVLCPVFHGRADIAVHLDEVVRYGGPILELATSTRQLQVGRGRYADQRAPVGGVFAYAWQRDWLDAFIAAACSDEALSDPDFARAVCWTRKHVAQLNALVRRTRYGDHAPPFCEGEVLMAVDAIPSPLGGRPLLYSSAEMRVVGAEPYESPVVYDDSSYVAMAHNGKRKYQEGATEVPPWRYWRLTVETGYGGRLRFQTLDPSEKDRWAETRGKLREMARKASLEERKKINHVIFERNDQFGEVQPASALTVHKSQGSTFRRVWVHPDTDGWGTPQPINNRLAYVGMTRASEQLHVVADA